MFHRMPRWTVDRASLLRNYQMILRGFTCLVVLCGLCGVPHSVTQVNQVTSNHRAQPRRYPEQRPESEHAREQRSVLDGPVTLRFFLRDPQIELPLIPCLVLHLGGKMERMIKDSNSNWWRLIVQAQLVVFLGGPVPPSHLSNL